MGNQLGSVRLDDQVAATVEYAGAPSRTAKHLTSEPLGFRDVLDERPPQVLIVDPDAAEGAELAASILKTCHRELLVSVATDARELELEDAGRLLATDLLLLRLGASSGEGLANAIGLMERAPWISPVFWLNHAHDCLGLRIAKALGLARVVARDSLLPWLHDAAYPMARLARARRASLEAERSLPPIPTSIALDENAMTSLPRAEQSFREAYLRSLLAHTTNRREAAERAGVPYTTLVSMLKKFGLSG
jgi:hypothetical protein